MRPDSMKGVAVVNWLKRRANKRITRPTAEQREAGRALADQEKKLREVTAGNPEILKEAERLKRLGSRNDFAARIREAMGGT